MAPVFFDRRQPGFFFAPNAIYKIWIYIPVTGGCASLYFAISKGAVLSSAGTCQGPSGGGYGTPTNTTTGPSPSGGGGGSSSSGGGGGFGGGGFGGNLP